MIEHNPTPRPRLYQDIDGVLVVTDEESSPFETVALRGHGRYAPEVIDRLGKMVLDIVWLSTRNKREIYDLTTQIKALQGGRVLEPIPVETDSNKPASQTISDPKSHTIYAKLEAINQDQATSPRPFVWTDDDLIPDVRARMNSRHRKTPHLLIRPSRRVGYTETTLASVEDFARTYVIQPTDSRD